MCTHINGIMSAYDEDDEHEDTTVDDIESDDKADVTTATLIV